VADRQLALIKTEVTPGTDPTPAASEAIWIESPSFKLAGEKETGDPARPGLSPVVGTVYGQYGTLEFDVPLAASGAAGTAPKWGPLAKACGWSESVVAVTSVTYGLLSDTSAATSVTIYWNEGRRKHVLTYARGNMSLKCEKGKRPMLHFKFKGLVAAVTTRAALAQVDATWTGWNDANPIANGRTTWTYAGHHRPFWELSFDQNDTVVFRDLPNQKTVQILGKRTFTGKTKGGVLLPSTLNLDNLWLNGTLSTFALVHESAAGKIVTVNGRFQQLMPDYVDESGEDCFTADLEFKPSAVGAEDDISIVLT